MNSLRIAFLEIAAEGFRASHLNGNVRARRVLLATSIVDKAPAMTGFENAVSEGSLRYCPVCDGYEATDRRIAVLGSGSDASAKAEFLRSYSKDVTLLRDDEFVSADRLAGRLTFEVRKQASR